MPRILIDSAQNITLIGGAGVKPETLDRALSHAPVLVAADGGAQAALSLGHRPAAVIGDMDSIDDVQTWQNSDIEMFELSEQDTTDFEKCLYSVRAPLILGCGFLGARTDHALAAMHALLHTPGRPVVLLGEADLVFPCPRLLELELEAGTTVSFYPLLPVTGTVSQGLRWSVADIALAPGGRIGTSNAATGGRVRAGFDGDGVLAILPLQTLDRVVAALSTPAR